MNNSLRAQLSELLNHKARSLDASLRIYAISDGASFYYIEVSTAERFVVYREGNPLPAGYGFDLATGELYALAQAKRWLDGNANGARITHVCTRPRSIRRDRSNRRWAA